MNDPKEPAPIGLVIKIIGGIAGLIVAVVSISFAFLSDEFAYLLKAMLLEVSVEVLAEALVPLSIFLFGFLVKPAWSFMFNREMKKTSQRIKSDLNKKKQVPTPTKRKSKKERKRESKKKSQK